MRGYVHEAMKGSVESSVTDSSRVNCEDKKMSFTSSISKINNNIGSKVSQLTSDSQIGNIGIKEEEIIEPEVIPIPMNAQIPEENVPLKWALENPSVLVSRRLAGGELYERVLALREMNAIKKVESSGESEDTKMKCDSQSKGQSQEQKVAEDNEGDTTLDDMLASISRSNESNSAATIDDFFGAFAGTVFIGGLDDRRFK